MNTEPICPHCGSDKDPYFSRIDPMGYFCEDCGKNWDEGVLRTQSTSAMTDNHNNTMQTENQNRSQSALNKEAGRGWMGRLVVHSFTITVLVLQITVSFLQQKILPVMASGV